MSEKFDIFTVSELKQGKTFYEQYCGKCHGIKKPTSQTEVQWKEIYPRMNVKVNKKGKIIIDAKAQKRILRYVITMSAATIN